MAIEDAAAAAAAATTSSSTTAITEEQHDKPSSAALADQADKQDEADTTIRKTPFSTPAPSTKIPPPPTLTSEQETKYTTLLESLRTWASKDNLTEHEQRWLTRECLLRYLRASSWNLATAQKRLEATIAWRRSYGVESKLTSEYISIENETGKQWIIGYDIAGRTCLYLNPQYQNTPKTNRQVEHLVFMLERCLDIAPSGQESLAILMNLAETRSGQGATIAQGRETLNYLQNHYPERLGRALLINLPWHFSAFMKIILPFVDPVTRAKIIINQPMAEHVPLEQLPTTHGGTLEFKYEHEVYWPALTELAAQRRKDQFERWVRGGRHIGELEAYLKGGVDVGVGGDGGGGGKKEEKEEGTKEDGVTNGKVEEATVEVDDMKEAVVERDGEVFEDAVEAVEKLTI